MSERQEPDAHSPGLSSQILVRTIALALAVPSCTALALGMVVSAVVDPGISVDFLGTPTVPLGEIVSGRGVSTPLGILTLALACLAVLPAAMVTLLSLAHARAGSWREAIIAAGVLTMLVLAACLGHR